VFEITFFFTSTKLSLLTHPPAKRWLKHVPANRSGVCLGARGTVTEKRERETPLHQAGGSQHSSRMCQGQLSFCWLWKASVHLCLITCVFSRSRHIPPHTNYLSLCGEPGLVSLLVQSTALLAASPMTRAAHLIIAFFLGCPKTWALPVGQENFTLPCETGTPTEAGGNAASSRSRWADAGAVHSAHLTQNIPGISGS